MKNDIYYKTKTRENFMEFVIVFAIIFSLAACLAIPFRKRIEQTIPIAVVAIVLIIYVFGLFDNLMLGAVLVQILTIINLAFLVITVIKMDKNKNLKKLRELIFTPGLVLYAFLFLLSICINKDRIFQDYDEFNHWAVIIKNMFMYNTYGTNLKSIVTFNEYPPFTAVFQYLFLAIKKLYSEDIVIMAQNILYFSIIIPITKNIKWDKSLRKVLIILPLTIFMPMLFYKNFYLDILVDAILGVMFAYTIYAAFDEKETKFKFLQIAAGTIMMCLTKTSGIGLAILAIIIVLIKILVDKNADRSRFKKELKALIIITIVTLLLTSIWYIKVNNAKKRWDFKQYVKSENLKPEEQAEVAKSFGLAIILNQAITERKLTVLMVIVIFVCVQTYTISIMKNKDFTYYSWAVFASIPIYLLALLATYATIFISIEASQLTCFERYTSTILLAYSTFQMLAITQKEEKQYAKALILTLTIILTLMPLANITEKYIYAKNYKATSKINRDIYTKIKKYTNKINSNNKILYIMGPKANIEYQTAINNYEIMPITITKSVIGNFKEQEELEKIARDYDYVFIYRMKTEAKDAVKELFEGNKVVNDTLYTVIKNENGIKLEAKR